MRLVKWEQRVYKLDNLRKVHNKPLRTEPRIARVLKSLSFAAAQ